MDTPMGEQAPSSGSPKTPTCNCMQSSPRALSTNLAPASLPQKVLTDSPLWIMTTKPFYCPAKPLTILQANVGRGATSYEIAFSLAHDSLIDIILIQEPYIFTDRKRRITKSHPV